MDGLYVIIVILLAMLGGVMAVLGAALVLVVRQRVAALHVGDHANLNLGDARDKASIEVSGGRLSTRYIEALENIRAYLTSAEEAIALGGELVERARSNPDIHPIDAAIEALEATAAQLGYAVAVVDLARAGRFETSVREVEAKRTLRRAQIEKAQRASQVGLD